MEFGWTNEIDALVLRIKRYLSLDEAILAHSRGCLSPKHEWRDWWHWTIGVHRNLSPRTSTLITRAIPTKRIPTAVIILNCDIADTYKCCSCSKLREMQPLAQGWNLAAY